jgi:glycosyltransferase involved in cell wall biosynthesis
VGPELSIIIPTFNRAEKLRVCLDALARQTQPASDFEVVVVDDGSADGTAEMLEGMSTAFARRVVRQENQGYGGARNHGAEIASGRYLLFLDDDVVASPELVAEHLLVQREHGGAVVVAPRLLPDRGRLARVLAKDRLEYYGQLAGRPMTYRDCWTGNLSVPRSEFFAVGGFAVDLRRQVDTELGYRFQEKGVPLVFAPRAVAIDVDPKTVRERIDDAELRGANAVELWRRHPRMISRSALGGYPEFLPRSLIALRRALLWLNVPPRLLGTRGSLLPRPSWMLMWNTFVLDYCYWRGVRRAVPDRDTWRGLLHGTPILMYQAVGERTSRYVVSVRRFERQLRWLERRGYNVIGLEELISCLREHRLPPAKAVALTFDGGFEADRLLAAPILERLGLPATFFLGSETGPTLDQARQLVGGVIRFGARAEVEAEVAGSRAELEAALGSPVTAFAYPDGKADPEIQDAVREAGFLGACTTVPGHNRLAADPYALRRLEVRGTDSLIRFALTLWLGETHRGARLAPGRALVALAERSRHSPVLRLRRGPE